MNEYKFYSYITRQPQYKPHNTDTRWNYQEAHNTSFSLILLIGPQDFEVEKKKKKTGFSSSFVDLLFFLNPYGPPSIFKIS